MEINFAFIFESFSAFSRHNDNAEKWSVPLHWLCSISNELELELLAGEFESRDFRTVDSLKYIKSSDLDVLFPSLHKLMMVEKQIIESEIEKVTGLESEQLPPRELFTALPRRVSYDSRQMLSYSTTPGSTKRFVLLSKSLEW